MEYVKLIIDELKKRGTISEEQIEDARQESNKTGMPIDKTLIKNGIVAEKDIATALAAVLGVPFIDLADYLVDTSVVKLIPEPIAQKYKLIPIFKVGQTLTIAMANPQDVNAIDQVRLKAKCEVEPVLATETAIKHAIDQYYGIGGSIEDVIKGMHDAKADLTALEISSKDLEKLDLNKLADAPPVIKLVNLIIMQAIKDKASDIHIEPEEKALRVRYRIDGILHEGSNPPKALEPAIVSRIKVLASMDIAEKRKPQDGRIQLKMQGGAVDMRVSSFPTVYGENIVIRILDTSNLRLELTELGMSPVILEEFSRLIKKPFGIILVTGPTGSGKTTTLYAALSAVNSVEKNIITIEDPVEYQLKMIRQTQINPKAGLTFASGLRSILRQDPDIIMVGEIRDSETAEIATQAALTGHLVFSTLHTNDATGAVTRLIDMGIEPFLISSSVIGALAQRLVRVICPKCKDKISPTDDMLKDLGIGREANILFYKGKGCTHCKDTGYLGRTGIYELLIIDDDIKRLIINKADANEMKKKAIERGMKTLRDDGIAKVLAGITTVEEILRVTQEE